MFHAKNNWHAPLQRNILHPKISQANVDKLRSEATEDAVMLHRKIQYPGNVQILPVNLPIAMVRQYELLISKLDDRKNYENSANGLHTVIT